MFEILCSTSMLAQINLTRCVRLSISTWHIEAQLRINYNNYGSLSIGNVETPL